MKGERLKAIAKRLKSNVLSEKVIEGAEADSRKIQKGGLFFALKGEQVDGHAFLKDVAAREAAGAVVDKNYDGDSFGLDLIRVDDVLASLQNLSQEILASRPAKVVAVTGSVGKTTTKEFIATLLEAKYKVAKTPGNNNTQVGLPLSILNSDGNEEIFVMEMGMTQAGEIRRLVQIAPPDIAVLTKVALSHAAFFPTGMEGIASAKGEIFSHPKTRLGIINAQAASFAPILQTGSCKKCVYSLQEKETNEAEYVLHMAGFEWTISERQNFSPHFKLPFVATHLCEDFLAAAAVCRALDMHWEEILTKALDLKVYQKRFETIEKEGITFINDSYNANPASMRAALLNLPKTVFGKKTIGVLGAMKELGSFSEDAHREVGELALKVVDHLLCFGKECVPMVELFSKHHRSVVLFEDLVSLRLHLKSLAQEGDVVLIKGSNSLQLWKVLED